jgi:CO/xanthine dehydrogenase Mo-binding subunit/aerobic-type carbon monoxide dehydrogenase small subunit (CoxS/CutS family)
MADLIKLKVNGNIYQVEVEPDTSLLYVLRNELGFKGVKYACGLEQCGACDVLIDGEAVPSCQLKVSAVQDAEITTIEGMGTPENPHPLQEAFIDQQATQCGYCTPGLVVAAQGLLNKHRYPTETQINQALDGHLCRCGTHERVRRAIKLRVARPDQTPLFESRNLEPLPPEATELPQALLENPDLDSWIRINPDETITVFSGKVEYGQGLKTALAQIAADELDVSLERIQMVIGDTERTPNEGMTVGSMSLQTSGNAIRQAAAEARQVMLQLAIEELEAWPDDLMIDDGSITDQETGKSTSYWKLQGGKEFHYQIKGNVQPKTADAYKLIGQSAIHLDFLNKVTGAHIYVQDLDMEDMAHGRVLRPPSCNSSLVSVDLSVVERMPGVLEVVRDGSFLGVIAEKEEQAEQAMEKLAELSVWDSQAIQSQQADLFQEIESQVDESYLVLDGTATFDPIPPIQVPAEAVQTIHATYTKPFHMHATIGPSSALGFMQDGKLTIWCHTQGVFPPRDNMAKVLKMPPEQIHVIHTEGSGCYGHNGADDAALDAALLARALPGRPVLLKWTRANENQWEPYSPATLIRMQASLDEQGQVIDWNHDVYSPPHLGRARLDEQTSGLLAAWHLAEPMPPSPLSAAMWDNVGSHRNADPIYNFSYKRIAKHVQLQPALRVSSFRGLGAFASVFALESFIDEVAHATGADPVEFRLRNLEDERAMAVIEAAAEKAGWGTPMAGNRGRGFAFARYKNNAAYCAVVVEVSVDRGSGQIKLERAVIAAESGQVVNPDGLSNQLEGGFIQAASMTLKEQVNYNAEGILSVDWETYPILTFSEVPKIETLILNRPGAPFLGSGEASQGPTPAAIANAVYDAVGIRLRDIPFLPERVKVVLESS